MRAQEAHSPVIFTSTRSPSPVELPVEDLLPRPEVQSPFGDRDDYLAPHDLPLDVHIGIVLTGVVVPVLAHRLVRRDPARAPSSHAS